MDNATAVIVGLLIVLAFGVDWTVFDGAYTVFLFAKFGNLVESLAIWR
jgi:hypothetical protein